MQVVKNSASQTYDPNKRSKTFARLSFYHPQVTQVTQVIIHRLQVTRIHLDSEFRSLAKYGILDFLYLPKLHHGSRTGFVGLLLCTSVLTLVNKLNSLFKFFLANFKHNFTLLSFSVRVEKVSQASS